LIVFRLRAEGSMIAWKSLPGLLNVASEPRRGHRRRAPVRSWGLPATRGRGEGIDQLCSRLIADARKLRLMAFVLTDPDRSLLLVPIAVAPTRRSRS
jgi:hypothetical protein